MGSLKSKKPKWKGWMHLLPIKAGIGKRGLSFEACVVTTSGRIGVSNTKKEINVCSQDRNPRKAFAKALKFAAERIVKRGGVFAGYRKKR